MHWGILKKPTQPLEAATLQGQVLLLLLTRWVVGEVSGGWPVPVSPFPPAGMMVSPGTQPREGISAKQALRRRKAAQFVPELLPWWFPVQGVSDSTELQSHEQPPLNWFTVKDEPLSRKAISFWLQMRHLESHWEENKVVTTPFHDYMLKDSGKCCFCIETQCVSAFYSLSFFKFPISF